MTGLCPSPCAGEPAGSGSARGSDLEWAYLTIAGGAAAVQLIGFLTVRPEPRAGRSRRSRRRRQTPR
jgi:hypothetical protein